MYCKTPAFVVLACALSITQAHADPKNCLGPTFDDRKAVAIARVNGSAPRATFVRSGWEDGACPDDLTKCAGKAFLVPGDLVMVGPTRATLTCVAYQAILPTQVKWTTGWLPTDRLESVAPLPEPKTSDWVGHWHHAGGKLDIKAAGAALSISGEAVIPTATDFHTGVIEATARPTRGELRFADDGTMPFDKADEGVCRVRMQRIAGKLIVEDNGNCGGAAVSFDGIYVRSK